MTTTKAFRTWSTRLDSGTLTKSQVRQFAAAISTVAVGEDARGKRTALTLSECQALYGRVHHNPVGLTEEHTRQSLRWLARYANATQHSGGLGMSWYLLGRVLAHFDRFTFDGEYVTSGQNVWPVWTLHLTDVKRSDLLRDDKLQYYAVPWQARTDEIYSDYWFGTERP